MFSTLLLSSQFNFVSCKSTFQWCAYSWLQWDRNEIQINLFGKWYEYFKIRKMNRSPFKWYIGMESPYQAIWNLFFFISFICLSQIFLRSKDFDLENLFLTIHNNALHKAFINWTRIVTMYYKYYEWIETLAMSNIIRWYWMLYRRQWH